MKTNETNQKVTIERLSELLNGNLWVKGDLKRIYLDRGYNTKKMSTNTFVFEKDGKFIVSCKIECPNQNYNWINSQEEETREDVYSQIEEVIDIETSDKVFLIEKNGKFIDQIGRENTIGQIKGDEFYSETKAKQELEDLCDKDAKIVSYERDEYFKLQNEWIKNNPNELSVYEQERKKRNDIKAEKEANTISITKKNEKTEDKEIQMYGIDNKCKHLNFGIGVVTEEDENKITIKFPEVGEKQLLKQFAKLEKVN